MADSTGNKNLQAYLVNDFRGFELNPGVYNLNTSGMELIGFPSTNLNQENSSVFWKGCPNKPGNHVGSPSSLKGINVPGSSGESYKHGLTGITDSSMVSPENSFVDFSTLRCTFPCEGNERPGKGLSLSLNSSNPSSIRLQSFELRQEPDLRFDASSSRSVNINRQQQYMKKDSSQFANSKFLGPAQELLNEFCNLGTNKFDRSKQKIQKTSERQDAMPKQSLHALDHLELQKRTTKLLQMLEEVDRRYKQYCDQMKVVVSSFEAVSGNGAATVYSALASRAMSKHFRCLKDGILSQIKAIEKAMGDKDSVVPGTSKGETPRLRLLDQALRQQRAFQQTSLMENHPWRPQRGLPERSVSVLRAWLFEHFLHPYPNDIDKHTLARQTDVTVSNWFINARVRLWKPMVEEMYLEEFKDHPDGVQGARKDEFLNQNLSRSEDQKPAHDQLVRIHSESVSSVLINNIPPKKNGTGRENNNKTLENEVKNPCFGEVGDSFGATELDFSSYPYHSAAVAGGTPTVSYGGGGGVSLTLGLYQHGLQSSLFYPRYYDMEDCQAAQYSILEGENQNLPYRNVMGTQLLHDLAG
ncbi:POX family protein isoform 1 [Dorcoceras hygrometricum]|uniref:POX family protein isoform 1 n=1 Tax=Dorcoceras hygrometricum TaxID=472368 RepID=A0A2Z7AU52_9LAMI|nr:POX family protein isoform 1 [Dorcoceras hygrometricum]